MFRIDKIAELFSIERIILKVSNILGEFHNILFTYFSYIQAKLVHLEYYPKLNL